MKRVLGFGVIAELLALLLVAGLGGVRADDEQTGYQVEETQLGPVDENQEDAAVTRDGQHYAYKTRRDIYYHVVVDGVAGPE